MTIHSDARSNARSNARTDAFERAVAWESLARRVKIRRAARAGFQIHLAAFVAVQVLLFVTWLVTTPGGFPWFVFPFLGWGIGMPGPEPHL